MPFPIKVGLSVIVVLVAIGGFLFEGYLGETAAKYAIAFLAPFMVVAMWIFPEVARKPTGGSSR